MYDRESDENFMDEEEGQASAESDSDEEMNSEESSDSGVVRTRRRAPVSIVEENNGRRNDRNARALRSNRRENLRQQDEATRSKKKRAILDESEVSAEVYSSDSNDVYGMSDVNEGGARQTRRLQRNASGKNVVEEDSDENTLGDDSEYGRRRHRDARHGSSHRRYAEKNKNKSGRRNLRNRENGVSYKDMDESSDYEDGSSDEEEVKVAPSSKRRQVVDESADEQSINIKDDDSYVLDINSNQVQL